MRITSAADNSVLGYEQCIDLLEVYMEHYPKLYLAGPDIFLPTARARAEVQRELCSKYKFVGLHPLDNNIDVSDGDYKTAVRIQRADIAQIREADIIVANCNPFRGMCPDDGTAYELGFANALGKPSYGYLHDTDDLVKRTIAGYPCKPWANNPVQYVDQDGFLVTDAFGTRINLMLEVGMTDSGGRLVSGDFETCLATIRCDLDTGTLQLPA